MDKTRTAVRIAGQEFKLSSNDSEEYVQKIAIYLNREVDEVQRAYPSLSTANCVILAALNLCDEYHKLKNENDKLKAALMQSQASDPSAQEMAPVKRPFDRSKSGK